MIKHAYLAGGCFWGLEDLMRTQPGVLTIDAGYTGGENENPTYENHPGHAEDFIKIVNDSKRWPGPVVTTLEPFTKFWKAEEYHQDYLQKNPGGYTCHAIWFESYLQ